MFVIIHTWIHRDDKPTLMPELYRNVADAEFAAKIMAANDKPGHRYTVAYLPFEIYDAIAIAAARGK